MKAKTNVHAGECSAAWYMGTVQEASGGGFYGSIIDDNGMLRYYNQSYTQFCPQSQGLWVGERVLFAPITEPGDRYGKAGCVTQMSCPTSG
jgi:hypothetical protein